MCIVMKATSLSSSALSARLGVGDASRFSIPLMEPRRSRRLTLAERIGRYSDVTEHRACPKRSEPRSSVSRCSAKFANVPSAIVYCVGISTS